MQKFILVDNKAELAEAWKKEFAPYSNVEAHGPVDIFSFVGDACVSPANSFGFMDGGIDLLYSLNMGWHVMDELQLRIRSDHDGELLVGQSLIIATGYQRFPNMICVPTMRVPSALNGTPNVYLAAKALFLAAKRHPELQTIVCPGLGTGTGGVTPAECARLMKMAYVDWYLGTAEVNGVLHPANLGNVFYMGAKQVSVKNTLEDMAKELDDAIGSKEFEGEFYEIKADGTKINMLESLIKCKWCGAEDNACSKEEADACKTRNTINYRM